MTDTIVGLRQKTQEAMEAARVNARALRAKMDAALKQAQEEGVDLSADKDAFEKFHTEYSTPYGEAKQAVAELEERFARFLDLEGAPADPPDPSGNGDGSRKSEAVEPTSIRISEVASRFLNSPEYKAALPYIKTWQPGQSLGMAPVEVLSEKELKALLEVKALVTGASATSGGAFVVNEHIPGLFVDLPFRPFRILDMTPKGTTESDVVEYVEQDARTNSAAETAEATVVTDGALPESAVTYVLRTTSVQLIGHFIPATSRALEDEGQLRSLLEQDLVGGLLTRLDGQIVSGNGTAPNLRGILNTTGILTQALGTDSRSDAIHKAITAVRVAATINDAFRPDAVALHPNDEQDVFLEKDANGNYIYGPPNIPGPRTIWGLPVIGSLAMTAGTGLVGAFQQGCRLWVRRGVTVAATDAHSDYFIREIVVVKVTMRAAFAAHRPAAFAQVTGI